MRTLVAGRASDGEIAEAPSPGSLEEAEGLLESKYGDDELKGKE